MGGREGGGEHTDACGDESGQGCEWATSSSAYIVAAAVGRQSIGNESRADDGGASYDRGQRSNGADFKSFSKWQLTGTSTSARKGEQCRQYDRGRHWTEILERYRR